MTWNVMFANTGAGGVLNVETIAVMMDFGASILIKGEWSIDI
jgi:hypothetical protein